MLDCTVSVSLSDAGFLWSCLRGCIPVVVRRLSPWFTDAANNAASPALIPYTEFYNHALDHVDLMQEYANWQTPDRPDRFSYCQYPFTLSIVAKRSILTKVRRRVPAANGRHPVSGRGIGDLPTLKFCVGHRAAVSLHDTELLYLMGYWNVRYWLCYHDTSIRITPECG